MVPISRPITCTAPRSAYLSKYGGQSSDRAHAQTIADFKTNRYIAVTDTLPYTAAQAAAFTELEKYY